MRLETFGRIAFIHPNDGPNTSPHLGIRVLMIAKRFVRFILCWVAGGPLHFERRKAVESPFRWPPATFPKHKPFGQNF